MKYSVISSLEFSVPAHQDSFHNGVLASLAGRPAWGDVLVQKAQAAEGRPFHQFDVRFSSRTDMDDLFDYIKSRMDIIPVLRGTVSKHVCHHDTGTTPCLIEAQYTKA